MEQLIKLRHFAESLTPEEFNEFMEQYGEERIVATASIAISKMMENRRNEHKKKKQVMRLLFNVLVAWLQSVNDLNEIDDEIVPKVSEINECIASIIRLRNKEKMK